VKSQLNDEPLLSYQMTFVWGPCDLFHDGMLP